MSIRRPILVAMATAAAFVASAAHAAQRLVLLHGGADAPIREAEGRGHPVAVEAE